VRWELRPNALECAFDDGGKSVSPIGKPVVGATRAYGEVFGELSSLLTVKTLTGMTTDVYPREIFLRKVAVYLSL
jgi:hypothetical protein